MAGSSNQDVVLNGTDLKDESATTEPAIKSDSGMDISGKEDVKPKKRVIVICPKCDATIQRPPWSCGRYFCTNCRKGSRYPKFEFPDGKPDSAELAEPVGAPAQPRRRQNKREEASTTKRTTKRTKKRKIVGTGAKSDSEDGEFYEAIAQGTSSRGRKTTSVPHFNPAPEKRLPTVPAGSFVWIKYSNYPLWPAEVASEQSVDPHILKHKRTGALPVRFLGSHEFAWVSGPFHDFARNFSTFAPRSKTKDLRDAINDAIKENALRNIEEKHEIIDSLQFCAETYFKSRGVSRPTPGKKARTSGFTLKTKLKKTSKLLTVKDLDGESDTATDSLEEEEQPKPQVAVMRPRRFKEESEESWEDSDMAPEDIEREKQFLQELVISEGDRFDRVEAILGQREHEGRAQLLVKFYGLSYLHVDWIDERAYKRTAKGKMRIKRFESSLVDSENPVLDTGDGSDEYFDPQFVQIERILLSRKKSETLTEYYVKWRGLGYEQCTWETPEDLQDDRAITHFQKQSEYAFVAPVKKPRMPENLSDLLQREEEAKDSSSEMRLMKHQVEGLKWLVTRWYLNQNSLLADEMGLGKTVQAIVMLQHQRKVLKRGPFIVIAPLSTLGHWEREIAEWTELEVVTYRGKGEGRAICRKTAWQWPPSEHDGQPRYKFDVLLTDYNTARIDIQYLQKIHWQTLVVDEAQNLKNHESKLYEAVQQLPSDARVLLTGTPLQNNTEELWSLMSFLESDKFGSLESFREQYGNMSTKAEIDALQNLVRPCMLRRLKTEVTRSMPAKEETLVEVEMTHTQKKFYRALYERNRDYLSKGTKQNNVPKLNNVAMQLRKCCNHLFLLKGVEDRLKETKELIIDIAHMFRSKHAGSEEGDVKEQSHLLDIKTVAEEDPKLDLPDGLDLNSALLVYSSGKMVLLHKLLKKLRADGHRVLLFSQFRVMLDIVENYLQAVSYPYERIDGQINGNQRQMAIDRFMDRDRDQFVFLLTTRAGGVGINLTIADVVIIFDSDWNPQNDIQAQARCHRIGQTKAVKVYRLITRGTYEEHLFSSASRKLGLSQAVLGTMDGKAQTAVTSRDVEKLLRLGCGSALQDADEVDETTRRFCEEDIDQILSSNSRVVRYNDPEVDALESEGVTSKATFSVRVGNNDVVVDIDDPDFWQKILPTFDPARALNKRYRQLVADHATLSARPETPSLPPSDREKPATSAEISGTDLDVDMTEEVDADAKASEMAATVSELEDKAQMDATTEEAEVKTMDVDVPEEPQGAIVPSQGSAGVGRVRLSEAERMAGYRALRGAIRLFLHDLSEFVHAHIDGQLAGSDVSQDRETLLVLLDEMAANVTLFNGVELAKVRRWAAQVLKPTRKRTQGAANSGGQATGQGNSVSTDDELDSDDAMLSLALIDAEDGFDSMGRRRNRRALDTEYAGESDSGEEAATAQQDMGEGRDAKQRRKRRRNEEEEEEAQELEDSTVIRCPFAGCNRVYKSTNTIGAHLIRMHRPLDSDVAAVHRDSSLTDGFLFRKFGLRELRMLERRSDVKVTRFVRPAVPSKSPPKLADSPSFAASKALASRVYSIAEKSTMAIASGNEDESTGSAFASCNVQSREATDQIISRHFVTETNAERYVRFINTSDPVMTARNRLLPRPKAIRPVVDEGGSAGPREWETGSVAAMETGGVFVTYASVDHLQEWCRLLLEGGPEALLFIQELMYPKSPAPSTVLKSSPLMSGDLGAFLRLVLSPSRSVI